MKTNRPMKYLKIFEGTGRYSFTDNIKEWEKSKHFLDKETTKVVDQDVEEVKSILNRVRELEIELETTKREFTNRDRKLLSSIKKARGTVGATIKVGQILHISKIYDFNYGRVWDPETRTSKSEELPSNKKKYFLGDFGVNYITYSDIEITEVSKSGKSVTIQFIGHKGWDDRDYYTHGGDRLSVDKTKTVKLKMRMGTYKSFYFNLMNSADYQEVISGESLRKINKS